MTPPLPTAALVLLERLDGARTPLMLPATVLARGFVELQAPRLPPDVVPSGDRPTMIARLARGRRAVVGSSRGLTVVDVWTEHA